MSGDVTYQMLKRLSYLAERTALENGEVIAGQPYWDIYFTGGEISGVTISDITTYIKTREVTTPGTITQLVTDTAIVVENNSGQATTVNLLPSAQKGTAIYVKDGFGNAGTHNITIVPNGSETIDGQSSVILNFNYQWILLAPIAAGWTVLG